MSKVGGQDGAVHELVMVSRMCALFQDVTFRCLHWDLVLRLVVMLCTLTAQGQARRFTKASSCCGWCLLARLVAGHVLGCRLYACPREGRECVAFSVHWACPGL